MADFMTQVAVYQKQVDAYGEQVLLWLNADVAPSRVTAEWPLARLSTAAAITAAYLLFVLVGPLFVRFLTGPRDPYPLKFAYNLVQVGLCSYMTIESLLLAVRNDYNVVCNAGAMLS